MDGIVTLNTALEQVNTALRGNTPAEALNATAELLAAYPESVRAWRARASALETAGQYSAAAEALGRVLDIVPSDALALVAHARMLNASGRSAEAAEAARLALDYDQDNAQLRKFAQQDSALHQMHPGSAHAGRVHMARTQFQNGLTNRAIAKLHNLLQSHPTRTDTYVELADMLWRSSIRHTAAEMCRKILESHPHCLTANAILMAYSRRMEDPGAEQRHLAAIAQVDPDHRETFGLLAEKSPVRIIDVPVQNSSARPLVEEDEESRSDWVDQLIASSSVAPPPTGRPSALAPSDSVIDDREATAIHELPPLDWSIVDAQEITPVDDELLAEAALDRAQSPDAPVEPAGAAVRVTDEGVAVEPLDWERVEDEGSETVDVEAIEVTEIVDDVDEGDDDESGFDGDGTVERRDRQRRRCRWRRCVGTVRDDTGTGLCDARRSHDPGRHDEANTDRAAPGAASGETR